MPSKLLTREHAIQLVTTEYTDTNMIYIKVRDGDLKILKCKYEEEVYKTNQQYLDRVAELDKAFNLTIKQINAMFDAYEVSISQIQAYKNNSEIVERLESDIMKFHKEYHNIKLCNGTHSVVDVKYPNYDDRTRVRPIRLAFDPCNMEDSLFSPSEIKRIRRNYRTCSTIFYKKYIKYSTVLSILYDNTICLNGDYFNNIKSYVIEELDTVVLWNITRPASHAFIRVSTGELYYNSYLCMMNFRESTGCKFMYCNNKIISVIMRDIDLYITKYNINNFNVISYKSAYFRFILEPTDILDPLEQSYQSNLIHYTLNNIYGDQHGLYILYNNTIYFMGDLYDLYAPLYYKARTINILSAKKKIKLDADPAYYISDIVNINYDKYKIIIIQTPYAKYLNSKASMVYLNIDDRLDLL